jgi:hypothetical protein
MSRTNSLSMEGDWPQLLCIRLGTYVAHPEEQPVTDMLQLMRVVSLSLGQFPPDMRDYSIVVLTIALKVLLQDSLAQKRAREMLESGELNQDSAKPGWLAQAVAALLQ